MTRSKLKNIVHKYKGILIVLLVFITITFAMNPSLLQKGIYIAKNSISKISRLIAASSLSDETNDDTPESEKIPLSKFEFNGLPSDYEWPSDWSYVRAGNVTEDSFPKIEGYGFEDATVDGVPAKSLGVFIRKNGSKFYYYRTNDDPLENDVSVPGIPDNTKIILNYAPIEVEISYEIKLVNDNGKELTLPENITKDIVFGTSRPTSTVDLLYSFDVRIPGGYTGEVYRYVGEDDTNPEQLTAGRNYPLGTDPIYKYSNGKFAIDITNGPSTFQANVSFSETNVTQSRHIVVELKKKAAPKFDASNFFNLEGIGSRGNTAKLPLENWPGAPETNWTSVDDDWTWGEKLQSGPVDMNEEDDGSYSYTWVIQTNTCPGYGCIFDSFEINGTPIKVPFAPVEIIGNSPVETANGKSEEGITYTITTLSDGTNIKFEYLRSTVKQRAYQITITNAHSNVIVTGGNLNYFGGGSAEISVYSLNGVYADDKNPSTLSIEVYNGSWEQQKLSKVMLLQEKSIDFSGDSSKYNANVRFKLMNGYENPVFSLESMNRDVIDGQKSNGVSTNPADIKNNKIYGPDADGYYYLKLNSYVSENNTVALLIVDASPVRYVVNYASDSIVSNPKNMPNYSSENGFSNKPLYDNNAGNYYNHITNNLITINSNIPTDSKDVYEFTHWAVLDENGNIVKDVEASPAEGIDLEKYYRYSVYDQELGAYIIRLQAQWEKKPQSFTYFVSIRWIDQYGITHELDEPIQHVKTQNLLATGEELNIFINAESSLLRNWKINNPTYILNPDKDQDFLKATDGETIYIEFVETQGVLSFANEVKKEASNDNEFSYIIKGENITDGEYIAFPKENVSNTRADDVIDIVFENNEAKVTLKRDDGIIIYVPFGEYTITETDNKLGYNYDVKIDGKDVKVPKTTVNIALGNIPEEILFTNIHKTTMVDVNIKQSPSSNVKPGDTITYKITTKNKENETAYNVALTDIIPVGLLDAEIIDFSVGDAEINEGIVEWIIGEMEKGATETLTFTAKVPEDITGNSTWSNISKVNYDNIPDDYDGKSNEVIARYIPEKLPSTGQLWWPVPILILLGSLLIIISIVTKNKEVRCEEK